MVWGRCSMPAPANAATSKTDEATHPLDLMIKQLRSFLRLSVPPRTDEQLQALVDKTLLSIPEPTYGNQLQDFGVPGPSRRSNGR